MVSDEANQELEEGLSPEEAQENTGADNTDQDNENAEPLDEESSDQELAPESTPGVAVLNEEVEILTTKRLKELDLTNAKAYAARASGDSSEVFFALVCDLEFVPRADMAGKYVSILSPGLVTLVASGVCYWPPADGERYVFVYRNTLGKPLMKSLKQGGLGWTQDKAMKFFIKPMVNTLLDLRDADLVHGNINPMNIFTVTGDDERLILGDCLASPPSFNQPRVFEPIERAQANTIAKGTGTVHDDLYAFGVCLTMLLRQRDPLAGLSEEEVIRNKIELGSYAALTGKDRFTGAILELLRGLLYDDRDQRWTLDEVMAWLDGQRLSPKQSSKKIKASRPIHYCKERYYRPVLLAMDLDKNQNEAMQMIDSGALEQWVERSLEDATTKNRLEETMISLNGVNRSPGYWDVMISRISMVLDPEAPIRFKGLRLHPEGIPYALAHTYMQKQDIAPYIDLIGEQLVMSWISNQSDPRVDVTNLISKFDSCRAFLRQKTVGYGVERCLYFLSSACHCVSEKLEGYFVRNPEDLMHAFEKISRSKNRPELFIDRHIAAFLSVKDRRMIDPYLKELNADEYYKRVLGNIKVVATIQKRSRMDKFPGIGNWIADIVDPVYERYHDRELRKDLQKELEKHAKKGDLVKIITILDNNDLKQQDFINFSKAMKEYRDLGEEDDELKHKMEKPELFGKETGQDVAAIVSGFLAGIVILTFAFMHFSKVMVF